MRSSIRQLLALLTTIVMMFIALPAALACESGEDASVIFAIDTIGPESTEDVTVTYTITPYAVDVDLDDENGCEDEDDESCLEDPEDPEPVSGTLSVGVGSDEVFELPAGDGDFEFELSGYETLVLSRNVCGETTVRATLLSNTPATFSAYVGRWEGEVVAEGALVVLKGRDERMGESFEAEVDSDGQVQIDDVPAGFYELDVRLQLDGSYEHIELGFIDLLNDAHLSIRLRSSKDLPNSRITCATMAQGGSPSADWSVIALFLLVLGQLSILRGRTLRRRDE